MKKKIIQSLLVALSLVAVTTLVGIGIGTEQQSALAGTSSQNNGVGFADGCHGVPLTDGHTSEYIAGYNEGKAQCQSQPAPVGPGPIIIQNQLNSDQSQR